MSELRKHLDLALEIASEAGRLTLDYFRGDVVAEVKADGTLVTEADREVEELIRQRIEARCPGHAVLGEELGESGGDCTHRWIIDPIDGTLAFSRGVPLYATLLALEVDGVVRVGVAEFPALNETLYAAQGEGCFWNGQPCRVSEISDLETAIVAYTEPGSFAEHGKAEAWNRIQEVVRHRVGWRDAYGHALVASGRIEAMLDPIMSPWDCGPFAVILPEAGGYFGDWSGRETIYGGEAMSTARELLPRILAVLRAPEHH